MPFRYAVQRSTNGYEPSTGLCAVTIDNGHGTLREVPDRTISASEFKAKCLALLDRVAETGERIIVTKHGTAVAQLVPLDEREKRKPLEGSITVLCSEEELIYGLREEWDIERDILFPE